MSSNNNGAAGGAQLLTGILGNTVSGLTNTVGETVNGVTGGVGRPLGDGITNLTGGLENATGSIAKGARDAGQWKSPRN